MVNGPDEVYVERGGRIEPTEVRFASEAALARRDRADPGAPRAAGWTSSARWWTRGSPTARGSTSSSRRCRSTARRSRSAASPAARPDPDELVASGTLTAELRDLLADGGRGAPQHPDLRGHRVRQDDPAQRAVGLHRLRGARDHDRGRGRAPPAPAPRGAAREPPAERRGQGRGDDSRPASQRAAHATGPDRDRRGARARGPRPADRAQHRPRRGALDPARELARRRAAPARDAGPDGGRRASARRDPRAGAARDRARRPPGPIAARARGDVVEVGEVVEAVGGVGVREVWRR